LNSAVASIVPRSPAIRLRRADSDDEPFMRHLHRIHRGSEFAAAALPKATLEALLDQQFRAQSSGYAVRFPDAITLVIVRQDEPVGRLILAIGDRTWRMVDILLLPSMRGQGIGTDIIEAVANAARAKAASDFVLSVLAINAAARRLYLRLGFAERGGDAHIEMGKTLDTTAGQSV
jgi:GNAT superfamily N-acetyltransferase